VTTAGFVCLMYHELELPGRALCQSEPGYVRYVLAAQEFEDQMQTIRDLGMKGVSVSEALNLSGPAVAITFDDGSETDLLAAAPALAKLGFRATFYVVAGKIGQPGYLSPAQLRALDSSGFEIGCHSMTHPYLPDLEQRGLHREIAEAKALIEQMLGKRVEHFSCPGGRYDARAIRLAKDAGFRTVATSEPRVNMMRTGMFLLGRVAITRGMQLSTFRQLCRGQALWKLGISGTLRDGLKRLLGNKAYDQVRARILKKQPH